MVQFLGFGQGQIPNPNEHDFPAGLKDPADSALNLDPEKQKEHQNTVLNKGVSDERGKSWIPREPHFVAPDLPDGDDLRESRKVEIHFKNGKKETRYVDDAELDVLHKNHMVSKVDHLTEKRISGKEYEYLREEDNFEEERWLHKDGTKKAVLTKYKYADPSLGTDHYVHLPDSRATSFSDYEKAAKFLKRIGYKKGE
jgi:hypothetical protein